MGLSELGFWIKPRRTSSAPVVLPLRQHPSDFLAGPSATVVQWQAIVNRAAPGARVIWRSGGLRTDFVDRVRVTKNGRSAQIGELLSYHRELAKQLHARDRVHTYGSFHIADPAA